FIDNYVENHPTCIVKDVIDCLCAAFDDLTINESNVYRHISDKLQFTLTRTQPRIAERNSEDTIEKQNAFLWMKVDLKKMVRPVGWSKKGTPVEVEVQQEGTNLSILGCMSANGLIAVSQQVPKSKGYKKQKIAGTKRTLPHDTKSSHFLLFVEEMASTLIKLGLHNMHIVLDNATIHKIEEVVTEILIVDTYSPLDYDRGSIFSNTTIQYKLNPTILNSNYHNSIPLEIPNSPSSSDEETNNPIQAYVLDHYSLQD
ncbi:hypothetical protein CU097_015363, partial [Rhizopus azygosporus]